jgi:hypothetical protein
MEHVWGIENSLLYLFHSGSNEIFSNKCWFFSKSAAHDAESSKILFDIIIYYLP